MGGIDYAAEYKKCAKDFVYFCETYVKIRHSTKGKVPFKLYDYQKRTLEDFENHRYNIVLKFRQGGLTTLAVIWAAWKAMFNTKQNQISFVSRTDREAKISARIVTFFLHELPDWLKPEMEARPAAHEKKFMETGGSIIFSTVKAVRGRSLALLIIDEAAFISDMEENWADLQPALSGGGRCIVISTPKGKGNWYAVEYHKALNNENQFHVIDIDVSEHPDYNNPKWIAEQKSALGEKRFGQEVLRQFLAPGETFLSNSLINDLDLATRGTPPMARRFPLWDTTTRDGEKGALWIWKAPVEGKDYIIAADSGEGVGEEGDFSAFQVFDVAECEQVAEFYSNSIPPYTYAQILSQIATSYNYANLVVEGNGPGIATLAELTSKLFYTHLYGKRVRDGFKPGYLTGGTNRVAMFDTLQAALMNKTVVLKSTRLIKEFNTFIFNASKKRPEAAKGTHDDLIMALAIALQVRSELYANIARYTPSAEHIKDIAPNALSISAIKAELETLFSSSYPSYKDGPPPIIDPNEEIFGKDINEAMFKQHQAARFGNDVLKEFGWAVLPFIFTACEVLTNSVSGLA
jgi:hypothetical protein